MEPFLASVVVLKRCSPTINQSENKSFKFCCICGWDVSLKINPVMTQEQDFIFTSFILQKLSPSLVQSKWICSICQASIEQIEALNGEMVKMEKVLKQLVQLVRLKMKQYSLPKSQLMVNSNCQEEDLIEDDGPMIPVLDEAKEEVMDKDMNTNIVIEDEISVSEDDIKPILVEFDINLNLGDNYDDFDSDASLNLARLEKAATPTPTQPQNCMEMENDHEESEIVPISKVPSPLLRSTRRSKLRAKEVIHSLVNKDEDDDVGSSESEDDEDYASSEDSDYELEPENDANNEAQTQNSSRCDSLFVCEVCRKGFRSQIGLVAHKSRAHNISTPFTCKICKKEFPTFAARGKHKQEMHDTIEEDPTFFCKLCKSVFITRIDLDVHKRNCGDSKTLGPFPCDLCEKSYQSRGCLRIHKRVIHAKVRRYSCKQCDYKCYRRVALTKHIASYHDSCSSKTRAMKGTINKYYCHTCRIGYSFKKSLLSHNKRVHDTDKTFKCDRPNCRKTFYTQSRLKEHLEHFHSEKGAEVDKTVCTLCQEKFPNIRAKIEHTKRAHQEKLTCSLCKWLEFTTRTVLNLHMKSVHQGEKPYLCSHCGQRFATPGSYKWHMKIVCNPDKEEGERNRKLRAEAQNKYREKARKQSIRCKFCKTLFVGQRRLECHIARYHKNDEDDVSSFL